MATKSTLRKTELIATLREAGLEGQFRIGFPAIGENLSQATGYTSLKGRTGEAVLDRLLRPSSGGGRGQLVEIEGQLSSGRTALAYRAAAETIARGELVGWVDLPDALDPRSLRRAGVDLEKLLWVRPPGARPALRATELLLQAGFALVVMDLEGASPRDLQRAGAAIWSRLRGMTREARATTLLLGTERSGGSFTSLGLYTERRQAIFDRGLFEGLDCSMTILRNRSGPSGSEHPLTLSQRPTFG